MIGPRSEGGWTSPEPPSERTGRLRSFRDAPCLRTGHGSGVARSPRREVLVHGAMVPSELLRQKGQVNLRSVFASAPVTEHPKRISVIEHRADGAVFAGINLHLNGFRLRFPFKDVFVWEHFAAPYRSLKLNYMAVLLYIHSSSSSMTQIKNRRSDDPTRCPWSFARCVDRRIGGRSFLKGALGRSQSTVSAT